MFYYDYKIRQSVLFNKNKDISFQILRRKNNKDENNIRKNTEQESSEKDFTEKKKEFLSKPWEFSESEKETFDLKLTSDRRILKGADNSLFLNVQEKHNVPAPEEGLYVVFVSLHVKTEENTKKNNRKKRKKRSFRSDKTQIKMELCGTDKCKPNRSLVTVLSLSSSHLQTVAASGLVWVSPHTKLTLRMSVSGPVMVTAGSYLSGVRV